MKKKYLLIIAVFNFLIVNVNAQAPDYLWAKRTGGIVPYDYSQSIAVDASGNVYTTGSFPATVDFDAGPGTFNMTPEGGTDVFISKSDANGNFVWSKQMGGTTNDGGVAVAVDPGGSGAIYVSGFFTGTADFDPGAGVFNLTSFGDNDIFIVKLDASGNLAWAKQMGGTSNNDVVYSLAVDPAGSGNVCVSGAFWGTTDFDPGTATYTLTSTGWTDIFIAKLDASGNFVWANRIGGIGNDGALSITMDVSGNIYTSGYFYDTVDFDPGAGTFNLTYAGGTFTNVFVSKYTSSGSLIWASRIGGASGYGNGNSIKTDASGNVFTAGVFTGTADFDPGAGTYNLTSTGGEDIFISKLNSSGNFVWAKSMGGANDDRANSIVLDQGGNVYTSGQFQSTVDFDPTNGTFNLTSAGGIDIFISKLDSSGNFTWAKAIGGTTGDYCKSTAFDASGHLHVTGYFNSPLISFGSVSLVNADNNGSSPDIFIAKLDIICTPPSATITPAGPTTFCSGGSVVLNAPVTANRAYQWKKGGNLISGATISSYTATSGGNYKVIVTNTVTGCSKTTGSATVVTVNALPTATIIPQGPTTFCAGGSVVLAANTGAGLTYKWKKGSNFISGATLSNYTATIGGAYKVQVTNSNGCSKTSAGVVVSVPCKLSENENESESAFDVKVYPNPNSGEFIITFSNQPTSPIQIELTDELGKVVKRFETNDETVVIKESNLPKGIYCLTARNNNKVVIKKINIVE